MTLRGTLYDPSGRLRAGWRLLIYFVVLFVAVTGARGLVGPIVATIAGLVGARFDTTDLSLCAAFLGAFWVMLRLEGAPWSRLRMGRDAAAGRAWALGLAAGGVAMALPSGLLLLSGWLRIVPAPDDSWWGTAISLSLFLAPAALWEELCFRGYLFAVVEELGGTRVAVAATSLLFGLAHAMNPGATPLPVALVAVAGVFLALIMVRTRSLWAAWAAHWAFNWMQAVAFHAAVSGSGFATADYKMVDAGPDWATGGRWGPEGGLGALVGMGAALLLLSALGSRLSAVRSREPRAESRVSDGLSKGRDA